MNLDHIKKNLIIYLSRSRCKECHKPLSKDCHLTVSDDLGWFAEKLYFDPYNKPASILLNTSKILGTWPPIIRKTYAVSKSRVSGNVMIATIECTYCYALQAKEYSIT